MQIKGHEGKKYNRIHSKVNTQKTQVAKNRRQITKPEKAK